ncbi:hypothetical protein VYU27_008451, partial [Nannochloropsis oceanica]
IVVEGGYKLATISWTAPRGDQIPDYVIVTINDAKGAIVKSIMVTANKATADVRLDATADTYTAELSFYDSATTTRGPRAKRVQFTTNGVPSKDKKNCIYDPFELKMKKGAKPGQADKYQLGIVGDYPTTIRAKQTMKLTFNIVSETATTLMVNLLAKGDFTWVGGKVVPVPAGTDGLMTVLFTVEGEIMDKEEYYVDALLLKDPKDYKSSFVADSVSKIFGVVKPATFPTATSLFNSLVQDSVNRIFNAADSPSVPSSASAASAAAAAAAAAAGSGSAAAAEAAADTPDGPAAKTPEAVPLAATVVEKVLDPATGEVIED